MTCPAWAATTIPTVAGRSSLAKDRVTACGGRANRLCQKVLYRTAGGAPATSTTVSDEDHASSPEAGTICSRTRVFHRALPLAVVVLLAAALIGVARPVLAAAPPGCPTDADPGVVGTKTVVLLVHGFMSDPRIWGTPESPGMKQALEALNRPNTYVPPPFDYEHDHDQCFDYEHDHDQWVRNKNIGPKLASYIKCYADASQTHKIVLVGHSEGGLAIRCAIDPDP